jgi:hypothetical protein
MVVPPNERVTTVGHLKALDELCLAGSDLQSTGWVEVLKVKVQPEYSHMAV